MQPGGIPPTAAAAAGPGVLRSILGVFLTGISAGLRGGPGPGGPARSAAIGAETEQANIDRPRYQEQADLDTSMKKAQLAMMQITLQRQLALFHAQEPIMQNAKLAAWTANGAMVEANAAKGQGEILFTTSPDQDPDQAFQALNTEWMAHIKKGEYDVIPYASGDPAKPVLGLYRFKNSQWVGGDYWSTANAEDPTHPIETRIPDGIKAAGVAAVQKWGLTVDQRMEKARHDKTQGAQKLEQIEAGGKIKKSIVQMQIQGQNWRAQLHETNANARARIAAAKKTNDKEYIQLVKTYQGEVDKADKWADDHKMATMLGWEDNPFSGSVQAYQRILQQYEAQHPEVLDALPEPGTAAAAPKAPAKAPAAQPYKGQTWSRSAWAAKNPGKDVNAAEAQVKAGGATVVP
jgi:hypothetical protein